MRTDREVPVPIAHEGDPEPTYPVCPFCETPVQEHDDSPYAYCASCRESVRYVLLPDQPDEPDPRFAEAVRAYEQCISVARAHGLIVDAAGGTTILMHPETAVAEGQWERMQQMSRPQNPERQRARYVARRVS